MPEPVTLNPTTIAEAKKTARSSMSPIMTPSGTSPGFPRKPGIATDCRPKRSGNMPTARAPSPFGGGETKSARTTPTVRNAKARGAMAERKFMARPRSDRSRPIPLACTTPPPMFLNGSMIAGTNPTKTRPKTARPGPRAIAVTGSSGVVRSIIIQRLPGRPTGPKTHPT